MWKIHQELFICKIIFILLLTTVYAEFVRRDAFTNVYIDKVLENAHSLIKEHNFDPYHLKNFELNFPINIIFPVQCHVEAKDIHVHGLSTIRRHGDATTSTAEDKVEISIGISVANLTFDGHMKVRAGIFNFSFDLAMTADFVAARGTIRMPMEEGNKPHMTEFDIVDIGTIKANNRNWGLFNFLAEAVLEKVLNEMKDAIRTQLRQPIIETLDEILQKIPMM